MPPSPLKPLTLRMGQSPLGIFDAAAVDPEEQKQETVEGQEARDPRHKVAEGWGRGLGQVQRGAIQSDCTVQGTVAPKGPLWKEVLDLKLVSLDAG